MAQVFGLGNWLDVSVFKQDKEPKNWGSMFVQKIMNLLWDLLSGNYIPVVWLIGI